MLILRWTILRGPGAHPFAPTYNTVEGQPIESRKPNNPNEVPAFPGQTRAPYHRTAPFNVTVLLDNMHVPYSLGFLPDGNIILVLRLPGEMRILAAQGPVGVDNGQGFRSPRPRPRS